MAKVRVPVFGTVGKSVRVNPDATAGATIGADLRLPNGNVGSLADLRALLGTGASARTSLSSTLWRLIREVPANVQQVEALNTVGLVTRQTDGSWITRELAAASARIVITNGDGDAAAPAIDVDESAVDHDALLNFVDAEHIDWSATGAEDVHVDRITSAAVTQHEGDINHNALLNYAANQHRVWEASIAQDIHVDNISEAAVTQHEAAIDHDALLNFAANEHRAWETSIAQDIHVDNISEAAVTQHEAAIDHDALFNFALNEHINHAGVTLTAGAGLTGGGTIAASRTFNVGAGTGITVNANDVALSASSITSLGNADTAFGWGDHAAVGYLTSVSEASVTQHEGAIDHDALLNFAANEHRVWEASIAQDIHVDNISEAAVTQHEAAIDHDALLNFAANEHRAWETSIAQDIHVDNISEAAVTQHEGALTIASSQVTGLNAPEFKYKASNTSRNEQTAPTPDPDLQGFSLELDSIYAFEVHISLTSPTDVDFAFAITGSSSVSGSYTWLYVPDAVGLDASAVIQGLRGTAGATGGNQTVETTGSSDTIIIRGHVDTRGASGTPQIDFEWAQGSYDASNATVGSGSWMSVRKLGTP